MTNLLAALAPSLIICFSFCLFIIFKFIIISIIFSALMLLKLATWLVFTYFTTTPPHVHFISLKHICMSPATPVEIIYFIIFFGTIFTYINLLIHKFSSARLEFNDSYLHLISLFHDQAVLL